MLVGPTLGLSWTVSLSELRPDDGVHSHLSNSLWAFWSQASLCATGNNGMSNRALCFIVDFLSVFQFVAAEWTTRWLNSTPMFRPFPHSSDGSTPASARDPRGSSSHSFCLENPFFLCCPEWRLFSIRLFQLFGWHVCQYAKELAQSLLSSPRWAGKRRQDHWMGTVVKAHLSWGSLSISLTFEFGLSQCGTSRRLLAEEQKESCLKLKSRLLHAEPAHSWGQSTMLTGLAA